MTAPNIYGNDIPVSYQAAFDGTIAVSIGDLLYYDGNDVKPFASLADQGSSKANLAYAAQRFAGVAGDARTVADTDALTTFRVLSDVEAEYDCSSATFEVGDKVSPVEDSGADGLENQKVAKTTSPEEAIGTVVKRYGSATTRVKVRLKAKVLPHTDGPRVEAITENLVLADFTDGGATTGTATLATQIPAGALVLGWKATVATGFTGDTTAVIQVGVTGDADRFSSVVTNSVLAAGTVGANAQGAANAYCAAATSVLVTVTGAADFTSVAAGNLDLTIYYLQIA